MVVTSETIQLTNNMSLTAAILYFIVSIDRLYTKKELSEFKKFGLGRKQNNAVKIDQ